MKNFKKIMKIPILLLLVIAVQPVLLGRAQMLPVPSSDVMFEVNDISWRNTRFDMQINNEAGESVKYILEQIGKANGTQIIVNAGVLDIHYDDINFSDLQDAFEYFINSYDLIYYINEGRIFVEKKTRDKYKTVLLKIDNIEFELLKKTLLVYDARLRIFKNVELHFDAQNKAIILRGSTTDLDDIKSLIKELDREDTEIVIEKIALNHAHVGEYTRSVLGREVQVKGIQDTLKSVFDAQFTGEGKDPAKQSMFVDTRTNSVVLVGPRDQVDKMKAIVAKLDTPTNLIQIQVRIFEMSEDFLKDIGTQIGFLDANGNLTTNSESSSNFDVGQPTSETERKGVFHGTFDVFSDSRAIDTILSAWEAEAKGRVLASPSIITMENMEAMIEGGETINVKVQSSTTNSLGETQLEVKEIHTGIILRVTPHVINDDPLSPRINMQIFAESSQPNFTRTTDDIPEVLRSSVITQVVVSNGKPAIIGGLSSGRIRRTRNGIPLLSDIPLIGNIFRRTSNERQYKKVLVFITPTIIGEDFSQDTEKEHELEYRKNEEFFKKMEDKLYDDVRTFPEDMDEAESGEIKTLNQNIRNNFELESSIMALQRLYHENDDTGAIEQRFINSCYDLEFTRHANETNKYGMIEVILEWMRLCSDDSWLQEAIGSLADIDADLAMDGLAKLYNPDDGGVSREITIDFVHAAEKELSLDVLENLLASHEDPEVRLEAVRAVARKHGMKKNDICISALGDSSPDVVRAALMDCLKGQSGDDVMSRVAVLLHSGDVSVRHDTLFVLQAAATKQAFDIVLSHLSAETNKELRVFIIGAMGAHKYLPALETLEALVSDPSRKIANAAVASLGLINSYPATHFALLRSFPNTAFDDVQIHIVEAIGASGYPEFKNDLMGLKQYAKNSDVKKAIASAEKQLAGK